MAKGSCSAKSRIKMGVLTWKTSANTVCSIATFDYQRVTEAGWTIQNRHLLRNNPISLGPKWPDWAQPRFGLHNFIAKGKRW
jgi:hypothetical protein